LAWGICMVILSMFLFGVSSVGVRLTKKNKQKGAENL